jgi:glutathione S-transferase
LKGDGFTPKEIEESRGRMDYVCDRCETALGEGPYLAGPAYTLADIAILPYINAFIVSRPELLGTHPRTREWYDRVMARPAVKATYQPSDEAPAH